MKNNLLIGVCVLGGLGLGVYFIAGTQSPTLVEVYEQSGSEGVLPAAQNLLSVSPDDYAGSLEGRTVIDVRTQEEYDAGHIPNAQVIDFYAEDFRAKLDVLPRDVPYALYCRSGNRSGQTLLLMRSMGFSDVVDLSGGIVAWQQDSRTLCTSC